MTTRISFVLILSVALFTSLTNAQTTAGKTFSKTFNTEGRGTIVLDLHGSIDLRTWDNPTIRIEESVSLASGNAGMLAELVNVGRYDLSAKPEGDALTITTPNTQKQIRVKGEILKENMTFVVFVPKDLKIEMPNTAVLADAKK